MMRGFTVLLAVLSMFAWGGGYGVKVDPNELMQRAEEDINNDLRDLMKLGAQSRRFTHKKITPL